MRGVRLAQGEGKEVRRPEADGCLLAVRDVQKVLTGRVNRSQAGDCVARESLVVLGAQTRRYID